MFRGGEAAATKTMIFAMVTKTEGIEEVQYIQIKKKKISQKLSCSGGFGRPAAGGMPRRRITKDNLFKRREKFTYLSQLTRLK